MPSPLLLLSILLAIAAITFIIGVFKQNRTLMITGLFCGFLFIVLAQRWEYTWHDIFWWTN